MPYSLKADTSAIIPKIQIMLCKFFFYNNSRFKTSTDNKHFMPHHRYVNFFFSTIIVDSKHLLIINTLCLIIC